MSRQDRITAEMFREHARKNPPLEHDVQASIVSALDLLGYVVVWRTGVGLVRLPSGSMAKMGRKGQPDLSGYVVRPAPLPAIPLFLEVKRPSKSRTSDSQRRWLEGALRAGCCAGVVRSAEEALALVQTARARVDEAPGP